MRTGTSNLQSAKEGIGDFEPRAKSVLFGAGNQLFLTKEVLEEHFLIGAPLRSNAEAVANNRCLAALPRKCPIFASANPVDAQTCFARLSVPTAQLRSLPQRNPHF